MFISSNTCNKLEGGGWVRDIEEQKLSSKKKKKGCISEISRESRAILFLINIGVAGLEMGMLLRRR